MATDSTSSKQESEPEGEAAEGEEGGEEVARESEGEEETREGEGEGEGEEEAGEGAGEARRVSGSVSIGSLASDAGGDVGANQRGLLCDAGRFFFGTTLAWFLTTAPWAPRTQGNIRGQLLNAAAVEQVYWCLLPGWLLGARVLYEQCIGIRRTMMNQSVSSPLRSLSPPAAFDSGPVPLVPPERPRCASFWRFCPPTEPSSERASSPCCCCSSCAWPVTVPSSV